MTNGETFGIFFLIILCAIHFTQQKLSALTIVALYVVSQLCLRTAPLNDLNSPSAQQTTQISSYDKLLDRHGQQHPSSPPGVGCFLPVFADWENFESSQS